MEKILKVRKSEEQMAEMELGKVNGQIAEVDREIEALAIKRKSVSSSFSKSLDSSLLAGNLNFFSYIDKKTDELQERKAGLLLIQEEKKNLVLEAMKKVKALEKLKEKQKEKWQIEADIERKKQFTDTITSMYGEKLE